jgi:predicted XRE-type DNA-binding protein
MKKKFESITVIDTPEWFDQIAEYEESLIGEATENGSLADPEADNEYTREISRVGRMCADYESRSMAFNHLKFKSPLIVSIERELATRALKQREAAAMLNVKESTFRQIIRGRRPVSMQMAKRLYKIFNIDPKLILEYS